MQEAAAAADFVRTLAAAALRQQPAAEAAAAAHRSLSEVLTTQKSLVLEVQFTGFTWRGQAVGTVDPVLLRAAGQLIMLRLQRIGFTADATAADLEAAFTVLARTTSELVGEGAIGALAEAAPAGIYASTASGEVYRPAAAAPPPAGSTPEPKREPQPDPEDRPQPETEPQPSAPAFHEGAQADDAPASGAGAGFDEIERTELSEFELLEEPLAAATPPPAPAGRPSPANGPPPPTREEPLENDLFHFIRAAQETTADDEVEGLPRRLRECDNVTRFDELTQVASRTVVDLVRTDEVGRVVDLLDALVTEAQRPDRNRFFREAAAGALRRVSTPAVLPRLSELMVASPGHRDRVLRFLVFAGGDALAGVRTQLLRATDDELRVVLLRALVSVPGEADRLLDQAMEEPGPQRIRQLLELARHPEIDGETALRWAARGAGHAEPVVRTAAASLAAATGGRAGLRVLLDLLSDRDGGVRVHAVQALGALGETAAAPFLARLLADSGDEEQQLASISALGRIGAPDSVAPLLTVVQKRQLFGGRKSARLKTAAVHALGAIGTPAAREALTAIAAGRDELAADARRTLDSLG